MIKFGNYIFFIEEKGESKSNILFSLSKNEKAYEYLLENGYLRQSKGRLSFKFVGIISVANYLICVLPKYYSNEDLEPSRLFSDFVKIIKVLKKAGSTEPAIPDYDHISINESLNFSEIVIADKLIADYLEYGVFVKSRDLVQINAEGEISWDSTLCLLDPIFSKGAPIYVESYNTIILTEDYNLISELHKWIIQESLLKYGELLDYSFDFQENCISDLSKLGSISFLCELLRKELNERYIDRDIVLIKRMIAFLNNEIKTSNSNFSLFGTGYFHVIWEKACSICFDNQIHQFKDYIPSPIWHDFKENRIEKSSLMPDIITTTKDDKCLILLDAKYYDLKYRDEPFDVFGNPGVGDISKQFLYHRVYEDLTYEFKFNCFLFPAIQIEDIRLCGFVTFSLFQELKVYNLYVSSTRVFEGYLKGKLFNEHILNEIKILLLSSR